MNLKKNLKNKKYLTLLFCMTTAWISLTPFALAGNESGHGGDAVTLNGKAVLADYFQAARWTPMVISQSVQNEIHALQSLAGTMGLSFGDEFWNCQVLNASTSPSTGCDGVVEYRVVDKLPVNILQNIKVVRGMTGITPYGYTEDGSNITYINGAVFQSLTNATDQALALVHERFWAKFGSQPYEYLSWYTTGLKKLREWQKQGAPYTQEINGYLQQYTYPAYYMITKSSDSASKDHSKFLLLNQGRCVLFSSDAQGSSEGITSDRVGIYEFDGGLSLAVAPGNSLALDLQSYEEGAGSNPLHIEVHSNAWNEKYRQDCGSE
jgi:hypothetical protein